MKKATAKHRRPHVALLIETSKAYGRGLLRGIRRYVRAHGPWCIYLDERGLEDPEPAWLKVWNGQGIITRCANKTLARQALARGFAVVNLGEEPEPGLPMIITDDEKIAWLASEHLLERGFTRFGYVGLSGRIWSDQRRDKFVEILLAAGRLFEVFEIPYGGDASLQKAKDRRAISQWMHHLSKPVGIFVCYDVMGVRLLDVCREIGVSVPEQVGVIGVDNDEVLCDLSDPPLSSIDHDTLRVGYEAAALLDRMMQGAAPVATTIKIEPRRVVARQSTDVVAIDDPPLAKALRYIREHAFESISVEDVAANAHVSLRALERRFALFLNQTPKEEISRQRLQRVQQLLTETDFKLNQIAELAGFSDAEYMCKQFKRKTGQTPGQYKATVRADRLASGQNHASEQPFGSRQNGSR